MNNQDLSFKQMYWPLDDSLFQEIQLSLYDGSVPVPVWAWIPKEYMESFEHTQFSRTLTRLAFEGEFRLLDDYSTKDIKEKIIITQQVPKILLISSINIDQLSDQGIRQYMKQNNQTQYSSSDAVNFSQFGFFEGNDVPSSIKCPPLYNLLMSQEDTYTLAISVIFRREDTSQFLINAVRYQLQQILVWLQDTIQDDKADNIRKIITAKIEAMIFGAKVCQQQSNHQPLYNDQIADNYFNSITTKVFGEIFSPKITVKRPKQFCDSSEHVNTDVNLPLSKVKLIQQLYLTKSEQQPLSNTIFNPQLLEDILKIKLSVDQIPQTPQLKVDDNITCSSWQNRQLQLKQDIYFPKTSVQYQYTKNFITYNFQGQIFEIPLTFWNMSPDDIQNLKTISLKTTYLQKFHRIENQQLHVIYEQINYSEKEVDYAIKAILSVSNQKQMISSLFASEFKMLVIGPPPIANLVARSLSIFLPPQLKKFIIFTSEDVDQCLRSCYASNSEHLMALQLPLSKDQETESSKCKNFCLLQNNNNRNIFFSNDKCICGKYRHMPTIIPGMSIQCISSANQLHFLDYILQLQQCTTVFTLCQQQNPINSFGHRDVWVRLSKNVLDCCIKGNFIELQKQLVSFYQTSIYLGTRNSSQLDKIFKQKRCYDLLQAMTYTKLLQASYIAELCLSSIYIQMLALREDKEQSRQSLGNRESFASSYANTSTQQISVDDSSTTAIRGTQYIYNNINSFELNVFLGKRLIPQDQEEIFFAELNSSNSPYFKITFRNVLDNQITKHTVLVSHRELSSGIVDYHYMRMFVSRTLRSRFSAYYNDNIQRIITILGGKGEEEELFLRFFIEYLIPGIISFIETRANTSLNMTNI